MPPRVAHVSPARPGQRRSSEKNRDVDPAAPVGSLVALRRGAMKHLSLLLVLSLAAVACGSSAQTSTPGPTPGLAADAGALSDSGSVTPSSDAGDAISPRVVGQDMLFTQLDDGFDTLEACLAATAGSVFNCNHALTLCKNGGFVLVVTDIANEGSFVEEGKTLRAFTSGSGDGPREFSLILDGDALTSRELSGRYLWNRRELTADQARRIDEDCSSLEGRTWWPTRRR